LDAEDRDVIEITSAEPISGTSVAELNEAMPGCIVARVGPEHLIECEPEAGAAVEPEPSVIEEVPLHRNGKLKHVIECMLFVANEPLSSKQMAQTLDLEEAVVEEALVALESHLDDGSGLQLVRVAGAYQLCTRAEYADYCSMVTQGAKRKLSKAALETLAVVAYRQPCTMPEIEAVRGVSVDGVMKTLAERGLVREAGRKQAPGRPILYATTQEFLEYFGLNDLAELPDIDMLAIEEVKALEAQRDLFRSQQTTGDAPDGEGASDLSPGPETPPASGGQETEES